LLIKLESLAIDGRALPLHDAVTVMPIRTMNVRVSIIIFLVFSFMANSSFPASDKRKNVPGVRGSAHVPESKRNFLS